MSRDFTASNQRLEYAGAVVSAYPCTMACWFYSTAITTVQTLMGVVNSGNSAWQRLALFGTVAGDPVRAQTSNGGAANADTTTGYSANTWHHACGVFTSATSRAAFIDGGSKGTDATSRAFPTIANTRFASIDASTTQTMAGRIAEAAIWNVALTDDEVAALAKGICPLLVRPSAIVAYWPLYGAASPEPELVGKQEMTLVNSPAQGEHPRILRPKLVLHPYIPAGRSGSASPGIPKLGISAAGTVRVSGAASINIPALDNTAAGTVEVRGALSKNIPAFSISASSQQLADGDAAITIPKFTITPAGTVLVRGTASLAIPKFAIACAGGVRIGGAATISLAPFVIAPAGAVQVRGAASLTVPRFGISAAQSIPVQYAYFFEDRSGPRYSFADRSGPRYSFEDRSRSRYDFAEESQLP